MYWCQIAIKSSSANPECSCSCWCCSSQVLQSWSYSQISALAQGTGSLHWIRSYFHCSSTLLHATCAISSQYSLLYLLDHLHPTISSLKCQDHKPLFPACRASLVEQTSSYSSCFLSVRCIIIIQLILPDRLLTFLMFSSFALKCLSVFPSIAISIPCSSLSPGIWPVGV